MEREGRQREVLKEREIEIVIETERKESDLEKEGERES